MKLNIVICSIAFFIGLAFGLPGCMQRRIEAARNPVFNDEAQRRLAQAYFRLGVAMCDNVLLNHRLKGEPWPSSAKELLNECISMDIAATGTNKTLLKVVE